MATCPVCRSDIEITPQNHGTLYTCPSCSAVFFVDWEGQPEGAPAVDEQPGKQPEEPFAPIVGEEFSPVTTPESQELFNNNSAELTDLPTSEDLLHPIDPTEPVISAEDTSSDFSEITDFGNADVGQAAFNYSIMISGIDSSVVYQQVKEALMDSKFGWDVMELMSKIKDGVLTIRSVNAVKASILVQRVKYLPVKVSWRQDVLSSQI